MLDLLIIRHEMDTPPGTVTTWAEARGLRYKIWEIFRTSEIPVSPSEVKAVVILGGSMDTWEETEFPWLKIEKRFIKDCLKLNIPLYGLCLGSQLLAEVLGGRVYSLDKWEIGFQPIQLLESSTELRAFHWHRYTFDLPPGAVLTATHPFCPHQAFKFGENVLATQFHPEADETWIRQCATWVSEEVYEGRVQTESEILTDLQHLQPVQQAWFFKQLDEWFNPSK